MYGFTIYDKERRKGPEGKKEELLEGKDTLDDISTSWKYKIRQKNPRKEKNATRLVKLPREWATAAAPWGIT